MYLIYLILLCSIAYPGVLLAADRYVSPSGSGSACSRSSPCSLNTGLSDASPGDNVIFRDGTYRGLVTRRSGTASARIVIRAENRHQAIIDWPYPDHRFGRNVSIQHSHLIIRGFKVDGRRQSWDNFRIGGSSGAPVQNIIIEDNWILNSGHMSIGMFDARNVIIRHNLMENGGQFNHNGEGFYLSSANSNSPVVNVEIYGNTIRNTTANYIDYKGQARDVDVHHNIFERHRLDRNGFCGDGLVRSVGSNTSAGNHFRHNIVRDSPGACYMVRLSGNRVDVRNNVFANIGGSRFIDTRTMSAAVIRDNTLCGTPTSGDRGGNRLNRPMSECNAEVSRIMSERRNLPGVGGVPTDPDLPPPPPPPSIGCEDTTPRVVPIPTPSQEARLTVASARAFHEERANPAPNAVDGSMATRWSGLGTNTWLEADMGSAVTVTHIGLAWFGGDSRRACFSVQMSDDSDTWVTLMKVQTSGTTSGLEYYDVPTDSTRYLRIVGHGNTLNEWNSLYEFHVFGSDEDEVRPPDPTAIGWCECGCASTSDSVRTMEIPGVSRCPGDCATCVGETEPVVVEPGTNIGPQ